MLLPRRRRLPLSTLDNLPSALQASNEVNGEPTKKEKVKRKRSKRRKRRNANFFRRRVVMWTVLLVATLAVVSWKIRRKTPDALVKYTYASTTTSRLRANFGSKMSTASSATTTPVASQLEYSGLYNAVRQAANRTAQTTLIPRPYENKQPFSLASTYGNEVTKSGCNLTVVFMDPRLATTGPGESAWFSLESVGAFLSDSCVLLQTGTLTLASFFFKMSKRNIALLAQTFLVSIFIT
jgi:hypothetical protein